jgi:Spy/CpxP family protein refolding chaperone
MKTLSTVIASTLLAVSLSINAESHDSAMGGCQNGKMMGEHSTEDREEHTH